MATKLPKPGLTESQLLAQVLDAARCFGIDLERQNTGAMVNPKGQMVRFGKPGASDLCGTLPDGRTVHVELKREGFVPSKLRGEKRTHFDRQLARLRKTNDLGGVGFWITSVDQFLTVITCVLAGCRVEIDEQGMPWVTDEPREASGG